mmetsp:Transcript_21086/g.54816  ORF Transcript_21086/g.54816 Transcript_21086/m.54816 type:complete len:154 (+) Transcript_21086:1752-2213(+)
MTTRMRREGCGEAAIDEEEREETMSKWVWHRENRVTSSSQPLAYPLFYVFLSMLAHSTLPPLQHLPFFISLHTCMHAHSEFGLLYTTTIANVAPSFLLRLSPSRVMCACSSQTADSVPFMHTPSFSFSQIWLEIAAFCLTTSLQTLNNTSTIM